MVDIEGRTPLHMACLYGEEKSVRLLLDANACKELTAGRGGKTPLDFAHESGATGCVNLLLEHDEHEDVEMPEVEVMGERSKEDKEATLLQQAIVIDNTPNPRGGCKRPLMTEPTAVGAGHPGGVPKRRHLTRAEVAKINTDREVIILS